MSVSTDEQEKQLVALNDVLANITYTKIVKDVEVEDYLYTDEQIESLLRLRYNGKIMLNNPDLLYEVTYAITNGVGKGGFENVLKYLSEGKFNKIEDIIIGLPTMDQVRRDVEIKREENNYTIEDVISSEKCNICKGSMTIELIQIRSGDEGQSVFYTCVDCGATKSIL